MVKKLYYYNSSLNDLIRKDYSNQPQSLNELIWLIWWKITLQL